MIGPNSLIAPSPTAKWEAAAPVKSNTVPA
jgi:hypothetical protein